LPRKGYKCITVNDKIHEEIKKRAQDSNRTLKEYVEYLISKDKDSKEKK
jgi:hypothetical protein